MDEIGQYHDSSRANDLSIRFREVRAATEALAAGLTEEDQCVQSMPDASPVKWHRAHVTWFFEQFVLVPHVPQYRAFDPAFSFLFNSYYEAVGPRHPRPSRGLLTRPPASEITLYRRHVDASVAAALPKLSPEIGAIIELGLHHEQQHQELLVTDILHAFAAHPLCPAMTRNGGNGPDTQARRPSSSVLPACGPSDMKRSAFVSTTRHRGTRSILSPMPLRPAWCAIANGLTSLRTVVTKRRRCGCRMDGRRRRKPAGRHRCIGVMSTAHGFRPDPAV